MAKIAALLVLVVAILFAYLLNSHLLFPTKLPPVVDEYYGPAPVQGRQFPKDDTKIYPFKVEVGEEMLEDLKNRLNSTQFFDTLPEAKFTYGVNDQYLRKLRDHWLNVYKWPKWEKELNQYDQYKTEIEGLHVHFLQVKPPPQKYIYHRPLLLVHGWPGSVFEFNKILKILTDPLSVKLDTNGVAFEVIAPSLPGYGWSDAPRKQGFGTIAAARIFGKLMFDRFKIKKFYCQGGDWGSMITTILTQMYPESVIGLHLNMAMVSPMYFPGIWLETFAGFLFPSLIFPSAKDYYKVYPMKEKILDILQETGYFHIQSTKPDTVGFALLNSPMGLAAYIIEKWSTWTNKAYRERPDGALDKHYSMDELITHVMVYWTTGTILTSQRFYKEHFLQSGIYFYDRALVRVPTGVAAFPQEFVLQPKNFLAYKFRNLTHYTDMARGGHFAAFEEPRLLAEDLFKFIKTVE